VTMLLSLVANCLTGGGRNAEAAANGAGQATMRSPEMLNILRLE
jgi:hypothetical protein